MIKFLLDVIQIAIVLSVLRFTFKIIFFKEKKRGSNQKSIIGKLILLISRRIHYRLNVRLKTQKESLAQSDTNTQKQDNLKPIGKSAVKVIPKVASKVVPLKVVRHG